MKRWDKKSGKGLALQHEVNSNPFENVDESDVDDNNCALLTKNFAKFLEKNMRKPNVTRKG